MKYTLWNWRITVEKSTRELITGIVSGGVRYGGRIVWEVITAAVPALLIALFINVYVVQAVEIEAGPSMQPNLYQGYRMMVERVSYRFHLPDRGDIVVADRPGDEVSLVKRVMGLPGETIEVRDGHVIINGQSIEEPWVTYFGGPDYGPEEIPEGYVFILGDNRRASRDSRAIGPVALRAVEGRVWLVYWPLEEVRWVP
jgi:signal peptidase I